MSGLAWLPVLALPAKADQQGSFVGTVVAEWLPDGRTMRLVQPFEFIDADGRRWPVPIGVVVDGASIPQFLWSMIGGPFEGLYRPASVVHDYFCDIRTRKYEDVHKVFYDAMIRGGVRRSMAQLMYRAVTTFGPKWADPNLDPRCEISTPDYDYDLCSRNAFRPTVERPMVTRQRLENFADELEGQVDPGDVETLRRTIRRE